MIKAKVIKDFTLERFEELKNIIRKDATKNGKGYLYDGDTFECNEEMGKYLTGSNKKGETVIEILEIIPEEPIVKEEKPKKKKSSKK
jgi:hypothetical protein